MDDTQEIRRELTQARAKLLVKSDPYTDYTLMPFGKYKGEPLGEVPIDYLRWWFNQNSDWEIIYIEVLYQPYPQRAVAKQKLKLHDYTKTKLEIDRKGNSETT